MAAAVVVVVAITTNESEDIEVSLSVNRLQKPVANLEIQEDDDFDRNRQQQRRRYEDPPHIKLRKQVLGLAESVCLCDLVLRDTIKLILRLASEDH